MPERTNKLQELHTRQFEFAAHLRDPDANPAPAGIEDRRMGVYRDLFMNNVTNFLGGHFPISRDILGKAGWRSLVRDFYRNHRSHSPLFPDLPKEFLAYLNNERAIHPDDPPFLKELAHYEWVEAGLKLAPDPEPVEGIVPDGDLLAKAPALIEPAWLLAYTYPVNEIGVEAQPGKPAEQPLHYLVYRNRDDKVVFVKLNVVSARLFELLQQDTELSGHDALEQIAQELKRADPAPVVESGRAILEQWRQKGIILGARP